MFSSHAFNFTYLDVPKDRYKRVKKDLKKDIYRKPYFSYCYQLLNFVMIDAAFIYYILPYNEVLTVFYDIDVICFKQHRTTISQNTTSRN